MNVRQDILSFLRDTSFFSASVDDPEVWLEALHVFTKPSLEAARDFPLRPAQEDAWKKLASERVGLVLGPPGTGKTHLLAWLIVGYIQACAANNKACRVLITAFTRNAVENLLAAVDDRIQRYGLPDITTLYLGNQTGGDLPESIENVRRTAKADCKKIAQFLENPRIVVGSTVWSIYKLLESGELAGHEGMTAPVFNLICVDEASQMPLGNGLIPLGAMAPNCRLVVAGDDKQLPPIRASRDIKYEGRDIGSSLYAFLKSVNVKEFPLDETFRLNAPLTIFPKKKFYEDKYNSVVEDKDARLPLKEGWREGLEAWEEAVLDPDYPICVLIHDGPSAATKSPFEAKITADLSLKLRDRLHADGDGGATPVDNFWVEDLAIVSPHRAHNSEIRKQLHSEISEGAFVETIHRIQGKERRAIILSYCVCDAEFALAEAEFIFSPELLNVASTRARQKLIVIISKRLLDAIPNDQELVDKAQLLREFICSNNRTGEFELLDDRGSKVSVELRRTGFTDEELFLDLSSHATVEAEFELDAALEGLMKVINSIALKSKHGNATIAEIKKRMARGDDVLEDLGKLHNAGWISLTRNPQYDNFWLARPLAEQRRQYDTSLETMRLRIRELVLEKKSGNFWPFYEAVRDRFAWVGSGGIDLFRAPLEALQDEGLVSIQRKPKGETIRVDDVVEQRDIPDDEPDLPELTDADFEVLNELEELEAKKINFGLFEGWTSVPSLSKALKRSRDQVLVSCGHLEAHGYLMIAEEQRLRSRMAETARELRYVKQRFAPGDVTKRPFLVRSLKIELRSRQKPVRDVDLVTVLDGIKKKPWCDNDLTKSLTFFEQTLKEIWGNRPKIAGFQARSLQALLKGWFGGDTVSFVVSADTGSGKTEAALFPLIVATLAEKLQGQTGCFVVIAYPRIRLATNQAQRIAGYLAAVARVTGLPAISLGVQSSEVPKNLRKLYDNNRAIGWEQLSENEVRFPLFTCPENECGGDLSLQIDAGDNGADRLQCCKCNWSFAGWVGSKEKLSSNPPNFFLPTTESLHQWMHDPSYGAIFGDDVQFTAPRAVLADEIHLYSHIHGAQVGLTLRRLLARSDRSKDQSTLAIGMSATLGDPAGSWSRLVGRDEIDEISPEVEETKPTPRGREYFFFVQPEVESRGQDIAGVSTTIQSLMCLSHNMRRRTGEHGGFRSLAFLDSIDKLRRLHAAFKDAEEGRILSRLRTSNFGDDPTTGDPISQCCGEPLGCDHFKQGECWWFAANDARQESVSGRLKPGSPLRVCQSPVSSGATEKIKDLVEYSDTVFSTSSLEVGFDDPDITLVYQHYSPQNLASFIQRKGRGGRGVDDRPITGVTLSVYSPRDSWWFRQPHKMINPDGFDVPLNDTNFFVVRGQVLAALLDGLARYQYQSGLNPWISAGNPSAKAMASAEAFVETIFGTKIWEKLDAVSASTVWERALNDRDDQRHSGNPFVGLRSSLNWIPNFLFDTINLPSLKIKLPEQISAEEAKTEDIVFGMMSVAPGNVSRRFHPFDAHWIQPVDGLSPWFQSYDSAHVKMQFFKKGSAELLSQLPLEARLTLGEEIEPKICRPLVIEVEKAGSFFGAEWTPNFRLDSVDDRPVVTSPVAPQQMLTGIKHETQAQLRGFPIVRSDEKKGKPLEFSQQVKWLKRVKGFRGEGLSSDNPGLILIRSFWGSDCEVRVKDPQVEAVPFRQIFSDPTSHKPLLHGFYVQTEGVQFHINSELLSEFVAVEMKRLGKNAKEKRWLLRQAMCHLIERGAQAVGLNSYEAQRGAEIFAATQTRPELSADLKRILRFWDRTELTNLFENARESVLSQHPLLSKARVAKVASSLGDIEFKELFDNILNQLRDETFLESYLRSLVLHGLSLKLKDSFIRHGYGNNQRVLSHVKLPLQFETDASDVISVVEVGSLGDGTARTFINNIEIAADEWMSEEFSGCPNADEDAVLQRFFHDTSKHTKWRSTDPSDEEALKQVADDLGIQSRRPPAALLRILFDSEEIGNERIELYDLACEVNKITLHIEEQRERSLTVFELVSSAVDYARNNPDSFVGRALAAYSDAEQDLVEESLSPENRLADQIMRISGRLCLDGCPACLHQKGDLMSDSLVISSVSRKILQRFLSF